MSVGHLYVFFGKMSIQVLCLFFNQPAHFLMLSCMSYFHILYINHLLGIPFANTLSHSICGLLFLLIVFFVMQKLFSLMQFLLFIFPFLSFTFFFKLVASWTKWNTYLPNLHFSICCVLLDMFLAIIETWYLSSILVRQFRIFMCI